MNDKYDITCVRCQVTFAGNRTDVDRAYQAHEQAAHNYMTGQQFYDRFDRELGNLDDDNEWLPQHEYEILRAAKKAAGLE